MVEQVGRRLGDKVRELQANLQLQFYLVTQDWLPNMARSSLQHGKFRYCYFMQWCTISADFQRSTKDERVSALEVQVRQGL
jgi:hypothetical protein